MLSPGILSSVKDSLPLFAGIISCLDHAGYSAVGGVPLRKYPPSANLADYEENFAPSETTRLFQCCADPDKYRRAVLDSPGIRFMYETFFLNSAADPDRCRDFLGGRLFDACASNGLFFDSGNNVRIPFRFVPLGGKTFVTSAFDRSLPFFTYLSYDSVVFAELVKKLRASRGAPARTLDFCCGAGFAGLSSTAPGEPLAFVDISESALFFSSLNSLLQGRENFEVASPDLFRARPPCDLILCNPPFVFLPENERDKIDSYGGGEYGLEATFSFLKIFEDALADGGEGFMITRSPVIAGRDYLFSELNGGRTSFSGEYYVLSIASAPPASWETALDIEYYTHVFIRFCKQSTGTGAGPFRLIPLPERERNRYYF